MQEDLLLHLPLRVRHFRRCPFWSGHEGVFSPVDEIQVVLEDLAVLHSQIVCGLFLVMGEWNRQLRQVVVLGAVNRHGSVWDMLYPVLELYRLIGNVRSS